MTNPTKPDVTCTRCGGRAQWQPQWNTYMHWDEEQEDTHAVVPPDEKGDGNANALETQR